MSQGNACAAIGLANTNKIPAIGLYVQDTGLPIPGVGPESDGGYIGCNGNTYWQRDAVGEGAAAILPGGYVVPANSGVAAGKLAQYVTTAAVPLTVAADGLCAVSATGEVTAAAGTGAFKTFLPPGTVVPVNSWLWVFGV